MTLTRLLPIVHVWAHVSYPLCHVIYWILTENVCSSIVLYIYDSYLVLYFHVSYILDILCNFSYVVLIFLFIHKQPYENDF